MIYMLLKRVAYTDEGTFGVLVANGTPFALTLERPWNNNRTGESCIPVGEYTCLRCKASPDYGFKNSPKFGDTFQVMDVVDRNFILFHKGNIDDDTHGCIIVGEQYGVLDGDLAVLASKAGFDEFKSILSNIDEFRLSIIQV